MSPRGDSACRLQASRQAGGSKWERLVARASGGDRVLGSKAAGSASAGRVAVLRAGRRGAQDGPRRAGRGDQARLRGHPAPSVR
jgi:hypothetical protein